MRRNGEGVLAVSIALVLAFIAAASFASMSADAAQDTTKLVASLEALLNGQCRIDYDHLAGGVTDEFLAELVAQVSDERLLEYDTALVSYGTRNTFMPQNLEVASWLFDKLSSFGLDVHFEDHEYAGHTVRNVIGRLEGEDASQRVIVFMAHYDTTVTPAWRNSYENAPGANDNGTAVSSVLEAGRILSQYKPVFTIEFLLIGAEEQGMLGSQFYVERSLQERKNIVGAVNVDCAAYDPDGTMEIKVEVTSSSEHLLSYSSRAFPFTTLTKTEVTEDSGGLLWAQSDHGSFWRRGIPAIFYHEAHFADDPYKDTSNDTLENLNVPFFVETAKLSLLTTALMAFDEIQSPQLCIYTDRDSYEEGDRILLDLSYANPGEACTLDFYLALFAPDGLTFYFPNWSTQPQGTSVRAGANTCSDRLRLCCFGVPSVSPPISHPGRYRFAACFLDGSGQPVCSMTTAGFHVAGAPLCPEGMVRIPTGSFTDYFAERHFVPEFCIDRYEYPNEAGQMPLHTLSWLEAWGKCIEQGKYLCSKDEWMRACKGPDDLAFPYGDVYQTSVCNTEGTDIMASGSNAGCISGFGVYDMSGNVYEWTSSMQWQNLLFGGLFRGSEFRASCHYGFAPQPYTRYEPIPYSGFRCCLH